MRTISINRKTILFFITAILLIIVEINKGYGQVSIWSDNMEPTFSYQYTQSFTGSIPGDWTCTGSGLNMWTYNAGTGYCANGSAKCTGQSPKYSSSMDYYMTKTAGISAPSICSFKFTGEVEDGYDYIDFQTYDGSTWSTQATITGDYRDGWYYDEIYLPTGTTQIRFYFHSDGSLTYEGIYIDDINIYSYSLANWTTSGGATNLDNWSPSAYCGGNARYTSANYSMHCSAWENDYSDDVDNYLTTIRSLPLGAGYSSSSLSFRVWNQTESNYDYIYCQYYDGSWITAWTQTGDYSGTGWQTISGINIPITATQIRFKFHSDYIINYEGVYIDDVVLSAIPACTYPSQATAMTFSSVGCNQMEVGWTRGTGNNIIVLARQGSAVNADPVDGNTYTANAAFGSGTQIGVGNYVVYKGTAILETVTNLSNSTTYYFAAYEVNTATGFCYKKPALTGNSPTLYPPSISTQPTNKSMLAISGSSNFSVTASGAGLIYQWEYSATGGAPWTNVANGTPTGATYTNPTSATMTVSTVSNAVVCYYRCVVSGTCTPSPATSNSASLTVTCVTAGVPAGLVFATTGYTSASFSWNAVAGDPTITYTWEVHNAAHTVIATGTTTNLSDITNSLVCGTTYHLRVKATSSCNGTASAWSAESGGSATTACGLVAHHSNNVAGIWGTVGHWQMSPAAGCTAPTILNTVAVTSANSCGVVIRAGFPMTINADVATPPNIVIDAGATLTIENNSTLTIPNGKTLTNNGDIYLTIAAVNKTGIITIAAGGKLINNGTITVGRGTRIGTININGELTNNSTGVLIQTGTGADVIAINSGCTFTNYGDITTNSNGSLTVNSGSTFVNYADITNDGTFTIATGALLTNQSNGVLSNNGTITLSGGIGRSTIDNYGTFTNNYQVTINGNGTVGRAAVFNNYGTYTEQSGTTAKYTGIGGTSSTDPGLFNNFANAIFTVSDANGFGMLYIGSGARNGTLNNSGTLNINDSYPLSLGTPAGIYGNRGSIINNSGGVINIASTSLNNNIGVSAAVTISNSGTINNNGYIEYYWGTFTNNADGIFNNYNTLFDDAIITNNGTFNESGATLVGYFYAGTSVFNNNLTYNILPMGTDVGSSIYIGYDATYLGTFNNAGTINNNSNSGSYVGIGIENGSILNNSGTLNNNGDWLQTGLNGGGTVNNTGIWNENSRCNLLTSTAVFNVTNGTFNIGVSGLLSLGCNGTVTAPGIVHNYGQILFNGKYLSGTGHLTTYTNSTLTLKSVSGSTDFINSGTGSGNIRISGSRTFDDTTNYFLSSTTASMTMGNGFPTTMQDLKITVPSGLSVTPASITASRDLIIFAGDVNTNNKDIYIDRDFSNGGVLTLGTGNLYYTGSGRLMSNLTNLFEDFESVSTDAYLWYGGWRCNDATWYCRLTNPRSLRKSAGLDPSKTNQWAASTSVDLTAGRSYFLSFWHSKSGPGSPTFTVNYSTDNTFASVGTNIIGSTTVTLDTYVRDTVTFVPASSGRFYIGIKGTTPASTYLYIDDVYLTTLPATQPLKKFNINSGGTVLLSTPATITPANGPLTLTNGAFSIGNNLTINDGSTIIRSGGIIADPPIILNTSKINVTYNTPSPAALITTRVELPNSNSTGYLDNLTINNSNGVTLSKSSVAPVVLSNQNFDDLSVPSGWVEEVVTGSPTISYPAICTFFSGSVTPIATSFGASMVVFDADNCSDGDQIRLKQTSSFATTGYNNIRVNFDWYYQTDFENYVEGLTLQWSTDGSTWINNIPLTNFYGAGTTGWQTKTVLLPVGAENLSNLYIAILFNSEGKSKCIIDNFTVTGMKYSGSALDVTVNGAGGSGVLTLTQGVLNLGTNKLIVNNSSTGAIVRTTGCVVSETDVADNTSIIQWNMGTSTGNYEFPFGTTGGTDYIPVTFNKTTSTASNISISTRGSASDNTPLPTYSGIHLHNPLGADISGSCILDRWWDFSVSAATTADITFSYRGAENTTTDPTVANGLQIQHWGSTPGGWDAPLGSGITGVTSGIGTITISGQSAFSPFVAVNTKNGIATPNFLPVELINFTAHCKNGFINCKWSTSSEINNDAFTLEHSYDGETWEFVSEIKGAGNSNQALNYEYIDKQQTIGQSYYRLSQRDFDGKTQTFNSIATYCKDEILNTSMYIFPNPAKEDLSIVLTGHENQKGEIVIIDPLGKKVLRTSIESDNEFIKLNLDIRNLPSGNYFIHCVLDNEVLPVQKFIISRR